MQGTPRPRGAGPPDRWWDGGRDGWGCLVFRVERCREPALRDPTSDLVCRVGGGGALGTGGVGRAARLPPGSPCHNHTRHS